MLRAMAFTCGLLVACAACESAEVATKPADQAPPSELKSCVYPVADLVQATASTDLSTPAQIEFELQRLGARLSRGVGRKYWQNGESIAPHGRTLSLVIRRTGDGHRALADCMTQLRRMHGGGVLVTACEVSETTLSQVPPDKVLSPEAAAKLRSELNCFRQLLHATPSALKGRDNRPQVSAVPSVDRKTVFIEFRTTMQPDSVTTRQLTVPVGHSFVVNTAANGAPPRWLLVTVDDASEDVEEAALLGIPVSE